jgi:hypothetical protein
VGELCGCCLGPGNGVPAGTTNCGFVGAALDGPFAGVDDVVTVVGVGVVVPLPGAP